MESGDGWWLRSPWFHAALLFVILMVAMPATGLSGEVINDEGAVRAQVHLLVNDHTWSMANGFPEADPDGAVFPIDKAVHTEHGFAPYVKHPVYPLLLAVGNILGGAFGLLLVGILGTVVAAVLAGRIARELDPRIELWTLWGVGLASPLWFDSFVVVAHTIGAAGVAAAGLGLVRYSSRGGLGNLVLVLGGLAWAVALRNEALVLGVALTIGLAVASVLPDAARELVRRQRILVGAVLATLAVTALLERLLIHLLVPTVLSSMSSELSTGGFVDDRIHVFVLTWLLPGYGHGGSRLGGPIIVLAAGVLLAFQLRRRTPDRVLIGVAIIGLWIGAIFWVGYAPRVIVPGILMAFPLLGVSIVGWKRRFLADHRVRVLAMTVVLFAAGVLATSYRVGGTVEWGSRYLALGIPLVMPLIVLSARSLVGRLPDPRPWLSMGVLLPLVLTPAIVSVLSLRAAHRSSVALVDEVGTLVHSAGSPDGRGPVVVTDMLYLPRTAWRQLDDARWLAADDRDLPELFARLHRIGVEDFLFLTDADEPTVTSGYRLDDCDLRPRAGTAWKACRVVRTS